jgi:hypothetical protein
METTLDVTAAQARVRHGAAFLDGAYLGWREHIDVNTLDMTDSRRCVLGQLAPAWMGDESAGYGDVIESLGWSEWTAHEHGFIVTDESAEWDDGYDHLATARLAPLWVSEIMGDSNTPTGP